MTHIHRTAEERRQEIKENAQAMGIDEAYISTLVDTFYDKIRQSDELSPIFNRVIDDWEPHLATMKLFWASVALNSGSYSGRPLPAHLKLKDVTPDHFQTWLSLFHETLEETAATPAAIEYFYVRAQRIANSLQLAMFGIRDIPGPLSPQGGS